jgi:DNA polymerase-4
MFSGAMLSVNDPAHGFCRDCLTRQSRAARRCERCGSPRVAAHPELYSLSLAHIDCDAFYAAVEKRDNPELADKPVIIGGGRRGVVSTACYIARINGVRSAMPMFKALEACPHAVVIKPDMEKYARVGREVRQMMQALTPLVQPISIDEAFLDLAGTERLHGMPPALVLARFARQVEKEIGITVSVGLSYCKFLAKVASDLNKPRGFSVIGEAEALSFLADKPVTMIWGVGKAFTATLERDGSTLASVSCSAWSGQRSHCAAMAAMGDRLFHLVARRGRARAFVVEREAKSVSAETTFDDRSRPPLDDLVPDASRFVGKGVVTAQEVAGIAGRTIVLKLKTQDFKIRTRNKRSSMILLALPTGSSRPACELLAQAKRTAPAIV